VWDAWHRVLLDRLGEAGRIDWRRACLDSAAIPAKSGATSSVPTPPTAATPRGYPAPNGPFSPSAGGLPLATLLTGANRHDRAVCEEVLDAVPPIKQPNGYRRKRPDNGHADQADDIPRCRALSTRHVRVRIARKGIDASQRWGRHRWVVERTLSWLAHYRRLTVRYERRADIHAAFLTLGCCLICFNALQQGF
jgi:transposase